MNDEIFKPIEGYEDIYHVSNLGRVKSLERKCSCSQGERFVRERILKPTLSQKKADGQTWSNSCVNLSKDGIQKRISIGRLVLEAFVGPCPTKNGVAHFKDGDPLNACLDNMEWSTPGKVAVDAGYLPPREYMFRKGQNKRDSLSHEAEVK